MKEWINICFSTIATAFIYIVGGIDLAFITLILMMAFDYITGIISAIYNKKLSSKTGYKGILKKVLMLIVVCIATLIDRLIGEYGTVRTLVIYYYVANEGISILENLEKLLESKNIVAKNLVLIRCDVEKGRLHLNCLKREKYESSNCWCKRSSRTRVPARA